MKIVMVVESQYGNTRYIAGAVAEGLVPHEVELHDVADAPVPPPDADLLVVAGPTHAHGMSMEGTRKAAHDHDLEPWPGGPGVRDWLKRLPDGGGRAAAAFDTRFEKPELLTGSAAHAIVRRLRHHGYRVVVPPESFFVEGTEGPLADGELERARAWAAELVGALAPH